MFTTEDKSQLLGDNTNSADDVAGKFGLHTTAASVLSNFLMVGDVINDLCRS